MYFKTCFVPIFDSFIWFASVLLENLKKLGNYYFFENTILVLILSNLKNSLFYCIASFIKVEQHRICHTTILNSTIFHDIKFFPYGGCHRKPTILDFPYFWKMTKVHEVIPLDFTIWKTSRLFHQEKSMRTQFLGPTLWLLD